MKKEITHYSFFYFQKYRKGSTYFDVLADLDSPPLLFHSSLFQEGNQNNMPWSIASSSEASLLQWTTDLYHNADKLDDALDQDPAFITFNDELGHSDNSRDFKRAQKQLEMVYSSMCGSQKSQFEL